jgi:hypothetical protein
LQPPRAASLPDYKEKTPYSDQSGRRSHSCELYSHTALRDGITRDPKKRTNGSATGRTMSEADAFCFVLDRRPVWAFLGRCEDEIAKEISVQLGGCPCRTKIALLRLGQWRRKFPIHRPRKAMLIRRLHPHNQELCGVSRPLTRRRAGGGPASCRERRPSAYSQSHGVCAAVLFPGHAPATDIIEHTTFIREPRKRPVGLSPEEVARLLNAAPSLKHKAALSVAYGPACAQPRWFHSRSPTSTAGE